MTAFWRRLFGKSDRSAEDVPRSMQDLRRSDPCWCGSGKPYRKCHRPEDRRREQELGIGRRKKSICDAFT